MTIEDTTIQTWFERDPRTLRYMRPSRSARISQARANSSSNGGTRQLPRPSRMGFLTPATSTVPHSTTLSPSTSSESQSRPA